MPNVAEWRGEMTYWYLGEDVICYVVECVVAPRARPSFGATALGEKKWIKQQLRLLEIFRNVDIFVHPENLWMLAQWKFL